MDRRRPAMDEVVVEVAAQVRGLRSGAGWSGVVVERGDDAAPAIGEEVFGTIADAQACDAVVICRSHQIARKPAGLAHVEAAALAAFGPSALHAVRLTGAVVGDRVMITGAGCGAGAIAVQIAKARSLRVTAVCCDRDVPLAWDLGADEVLARERDAGASARFVAVIDTDESVTPEAAARLLEPNGVVVTVGSLTPDDVDPAELVKLVEEDRVFPETWP